MRRLTPSKLRRILWRLMKKRMWIITPVRYNTTPRILNDSWTINLRATIGKQDNQTS